MSNYGQYGQGYGNAGHQPSVQPDPRVSPLAPPDVRAEINTKLAREIVEVIMRKAKPLSDAVFNLPQSQEEFLFKMDVGGRLWLLLQLHEKDTVIIDNRLLSAFTDLVQTANTMNADLSLGQELSDLMEKMPVPDSVIYVKEPAKPNLSSRDDMRP